MRLPQDRILHIDAEIANGKVNVVAEWQGELVRCKDCEYWKGDGTFTINGNGEEEKLCKWWSKFGTIKTAESGFCSYGERREP